MNYNSLQVKSKYIKGTDVKFYVKNFKCLLPLLYLCNNYNLYYFIITSETKEDILDIKQHLLNNKKNPEFNTDNLSFVYTSEEQKEWCKESGFNHELDDGEIIFDEYIPKILTEPPAFVFANNSRLVNYYKDENIRIIHLEGFVHNWYLLHALNKTTYTFISWPCFIDKNVCQTCINALFTLNPNYNKKNIIWLSPDLDGILYAYECGFNAILANHNCCLDYNVFDLKDDERIYNLVINSRPEIWKRPYLAKKVSNLAYIKGAIYRKNEIYDYCELPCKFINEKRLTPEEVNDIYNKSYCGGIFSEKEGACYSSSEYLLSGLPVISTLSKGGRDAWYTKDNSIIVNDDEDSIVNAVNLCIENLKSGKFNRQNIRNKHIELTHSMRNNIIEYTKYLFGKHNIKVDAAKYWEKMYFHKFIRNVRLEDAIIILQS
jgi:hypothetical protein